MADGGPDERKEKYIFRNISGIVFEDMVKEANDDTDDEKIGDGEMKTSDGDKPAKNVLVKLYEIIKQDTNGDNIKDKDYLVDTGMWYRTGDDGRYYFGDKDGSGDSDNESTDDKYRLHAGAYIVRFVYGDEPTKLVSDDGLTIRYSGQDFKSAKYTEVGTENDETEVLEINKFTEKSGNTTPFDSNNEPVLGDQVMSVAKDNEIRRLQVNNYSTNMTYPMDTVLKANNGDFTEMLVLANNTSMFADTKAFNMNIEHIDNYSDQENKIIDGTLEFLKTETYEGTTKVTIENYTYSARDINFGIIERPRTKLQLMNDISEIKAVTSDGNTLIDMFFDILYSENDDGSIEHKSIVNTEKSIGAGQVQVLDRNAGNQGFRYANIDTDILQGMTITIKYKISVGNISDVDHLAGWLEEEIENKPAIDLDVSYEDNTVLQNVKLLNGNNTEFYNTQTRRYSRDRSYLNGLLYNSSLDELNDTTKYPLGLRYTSTGSAAPATGGATRETKPYTYNNIRLVDPNYKIGKYLGNIYYNNKVSYDDGGNQYESKVKTRVDQIISYVDTDLVFKSEENKNENNQIKYLTYSTEEIAKRGLLRDITDEVKEVSNGKNYYYKADDPQVNNNLAFNIEDGTINEYFYKFLTSIQSEDYKEITETTLGEDYNKDNDEDDTIKFIGCESDNGPFDADGNVLSEYNEKIKEKLYTIDLQASKVLTSELDLEGVVIDNLAEIIKVANTAGRKVYVKASNSDTASLPDALKPSGFIGNTTLTGRISAIERKDSTLTLVDLARPEIDTDFTEYVTFSPPTGLTELQQKQNSAINALLLIIPSLIIIAGVGYVTVQIVKRKKFYK